MNIHHNHDSTQIEHVAIRIINPNANVNASGESSSADGTLVTQVWSKKARLGRAIRISSKIVGCVVLACFSALFIHPLILPSLTTLVLTLIALPMVFSYFLGQEATFLQANGQCPHCAHSGQLKRYLSDTVADEMTLLCRECGQTCRVQLVKTSQVSETLTS
jgi:hypothetical protein